MARNAEVTRQWQVLRDIDAARTGITIPKLAAARDVHQRTIRRDIDALASAGFPLFDEKVNGTTMWKLRARPFRGLEEMGLSVMELCALYFSRAMLSSLAGAPYQADAERAFAKIERALPQGCRQFLDNLPVAIKAKFAGRKKTDERRVAEIVNRATDALLRHRRVAMRYDSHASAPRQGLHRRTAAHLVCGWRDVPDRICPGIRRAAQLRGRADPDAGGDRRAVRPSPAAV